MASLAELMIVTFSRAATHELRSRVRERLELTVQALRGCLSGTPPAEPDAVLHHLCSGEPAELAVVNPDAPWSVQAEELASLSANTPYAGMSFSARVLGTVHGGRLVTAGGEVLG